MLAPGDGVEGVIFTQFPQSGTIPAPNPADQAAYNEMRRDGVVAWNDIAAKMTTYFPGRVMYLPVAGSLLLDGRTYSAWLPPEGDPHAPSNEWTRVRKLDNVHLCPEGSARYADALLSDMTAVFGLAPTAGDWSQGSWTRDPNFNNPPGRLPGRPPSRRLSPIAGRRLPTAGRRRADAELIVLSAVADDLELLQLAPDDGHHLEPVVRPAGQGATCPRRGRHAARDEAVGAGGRGRRVVHRVRRGVGDRRLQVTLIVIVLSGELQLAAGLTAQRAAPARAPLPCWRWPGGPPSWWLPTPAPRPRPCSSAASTTRTTRSLPSRLLDGPPRRSLGRPLRGGRGPISWSSYPWPGSWSRSPTHRWRSRR